MNVLLVPGSTGSYIFPEYWPEIQLCCLVYGVVSLGCPGAYFSLKH